MSNAQLHQNNIVSN